MVTPCHTSRIEQRHYGNRKFNKNDNFKNYDKERIHHDKHRESERGDRNDRNERGYNRGYRKPTCKTCHKNGHTDYHCEFNRNKPKCITCRRVGHTQEGCWFNQRQEKNMMVSDENHEQHEDYLFTVSDSPVKDTGEVLSWVIDSGATRHVTKHAEILENEQELTHPIPVQVANKQVLKLNTLGDVKLKPEVTLGEVALMKILQVM